MTKYIPLFLGLICLSFTGCTALFSAQEYQLIDQKITEKVVFYGIVYSIPEKANIRKIVLHGTGKVHNYLFSIRDKRNAWKPVKQIKSAIEFPYELFIVAYTDAIKIEHHTVRGKGRINYIEFYTYVEKEELND